MTIDTDALGIRPDRRPEVRIRMGRKSGQGGVVEKDRFHLCTARASGAGMKAVSDYHPSFVEFNRADVGPRQELRGTLIHAQWEAPERHGDGCAWSRFDAARLPGHEVPSGMRPVCTGDGHRAKRWFGRGTAARWVDIECPGNGCEFRQGDSPPCKRSSTLVFQLRWVETGPFGRLPCASAFIESAGPWSYATMQWWGFYAGIKTQWEMMGGQGAPDLYSLPIRLSLQRRTVPGRGAEVWVPELFTDFARGLTLQSFLAWRAEQTAKAAPMLTGSTRLALPGEVAGARETGRTKEVLDVDCTPVEPPVRGGR